MHKNVLLIARYLIVIKISGTNHVLNITILTFIIASNFLKIKELLNTIYIIVLQFVVGSHYLFLIVKLGNNTM